MQSIGTYQEFKGTVIDKSAFQCCGSKYIEFGFGSRILAQFGSGFGSLTILGIYILNFSSFVYILYYIYISVADPHLLLCGSISGTLRSEPQHCCIQEITI